MALFIGKESGIAKETLQRWYEQMILGEITIGELFSNIQVRITEAGLANAFEGIKRSLPFFAA